MREFKKRYECICFSGEITEGPIQSWFGEYMAVYQALKKVEDHPKIPLAIMTDHESLSKIFILITTCSDKQFTNMSKNNGMPLLSSMRALEKKRSFKTSIKWVKAHSGKFGNSVADDLAGKYFYPKVQLPLFQHFECPDVHSIESCQTLILFHDALTQLPIRECLKQIHKLRDQKEGQLHLSKHNISKENNWEYTFATINDGVKSTSRKTNRQSHYERALSFKMLAFILPVQARLFLWFPDIYPDGLCRLCGTEIEDNKHVWTCKSLYAIARRTEILDNARELLLKAIIGPAVNHYFKHIVELTLNRIYCLSTSPSVLSSIFQFIPSLQKSNTLANIETRLFQVTFQDLAIGTLPQCLIECIQEIHIAVNPALYPSREASARIHDDVLQICNLIKKDAAEYWKERCRITIEWEERNGITKKNKRKVPRVLDPDATIKRKRVTKDPKSTKLQSHADKYYKSQELMEDISHAMDRKPKAGWEFANPAKKLKTIDKVESGRSLPSPETQDMRLENILVATTKPIYIPTRKIDNVVVFSDSEEEENGNCPKRTAKQEPNIFFRTGGLIRAMFNSIGWSGAVETDEEVGGGVERRSGITSLRELPEGEIRALGTDEGRDLIWESGICGHDNSDNESVGS
jgi:ribonuclease HI